MVRGQLQGRERYLGTKQGLETRQELQITLRPAIPWIDWHLILSEQRTKADCNVSRVKPNLVWDGQQLPSLALWSLEFGEWSMLIICINNNIAEHMELWTTTRKCQWWFPAWRWRLVEGRVTWRRFGENNEAADHCHFFSQWEYPM